jgi:hypothetical protein
MVGKKLLHSKRPRPQAKQNLDATLRELAIFIGEDRVRALVSIFIISLSGCIHSIADISDIALANQMHSWRTAAAQLGFQELSAVCSQVEKAANAGYGAAHHGELLDAARRAIRLAEESNYCSRVRKAA